MDNNIQTSNEEVVADENFNPEIPQTSEDSSKETESVSDAGQETDEIDYKVKFSESTREVQRLLERDKARDAELAQERQERSRIQAEREQELKMLQEQNPEAYKALGLEKTVAELQRNLLIEKEERQLKDFVSDNPIAKSHMEALRKLGRAEPNKSYSELWGSYFQPAFEGGKKTAEQSLKQARAKQPESGKGSISAEPSSKLDEEAFKKLPLDKKKEYLKKMGL